MENKKKIIDITHFPASDRIVYKTEDGLMGETKGSYDDAMKMYKESNNPASTVERHDRSAGYSGENITNAANGKNSPSDREKSVIGGGYNPNNITSANSHLAESGYSGTNISSTNADFDKNIRKKKYDRDSLEYHD